MSKICPKCGYEGDSNFCPECGAEMIEKEKEDKIEPAKEESAISSEPQLESPSKKGIRTWSKKKKIFAGIGIFVLLLVIVAAILLIIYWPDSVSEEDKGNYEYKDYIHSCGFVLDNTKQKLLVRPAKEGEGFIAVNDVDVIYTQVLMWDYWGDETDIATIAKDDQENNVLDERKDIGEVEDIEIAGCKCKTFSFLNKTDHYWYRVYYIQSDKIYNAEAKWFNSDYSDITDIIETMEKDEQQPTEETAPDTSDQQKDTEAEKKETTDTSDNSNTASKKREQADMDEDEIFMVMALAEKEIKNNLTYDAKKAKFSHLPEDWYMSEQDGYYTVMTTFEAPNEYGTMQKAGAVVSFTVTSKSSDGWNYKDEDVYIEWKQ